MFSKMFQKIVRALNISLFNNVDSIVMYICGNTTLPSPLDSDEEMVLLEELEAGNEQAREKLIEHNLRLVVYIAKKFENSNINLEDLFSIGAIGLIKAVKTYKYDKKIKLATYASRCIENEILMQLRKTSKLKNEISIEEPLASDGEGGELCLLDILASDTDLVSKNMDKNADKQILWNIIDGLGEREKEIMTLRFGLLGDEEKTQKEVADIMGISQSYISRMEKKILYKMRCDLNKVL